MSKSPYFPISKEPWVFCLPKAAAVGIKKKKQILKFSRKFSITVLYISNLR